MNSQIRSLEVDCLKNERRICQLQINIEEVKSHIKDRSEVKVNSSIVAFMGVLPGTFGPYPYTTNFGLGFYMKILERKPTRGQQCGFDRTL